MGGVLITVKFIGPYSVDALRWCDMLRGDLQELYRLRELKLTFKQKEAQLESYSSANLLVVFVHGWGELKQAEQALKQNIFNPAFEDEAIVVDVKDKAHFKLIEEIDDLITRYRNQTPPSLWEEF